MSETNEIDKSMDNENNNNPGNLRKSIMSLYVKQFDNCINHFTCKDRNRVNNDDTCDSEDDENDDDSEYCKDNGVVENDADSEHQFNSRVTDAKNICDSPNLKSNENDLSFHGNIIKTSPREEVAPVRVSTTSFSVSDILDPMKFTGCNTIGKAVPSGPLQPWLSRKRRLTDELESDDDKMMEENG